MYYVSNGGFETFSSCRLFYVYAVIQLVCLMAPTVPLSSVGKK